MRIVIYDGAEQVEKINLPREVSDYDIIIGPSVDSELPDVENEGTPPTLPDISPEEIDTENNRATYLRMRDNPDSQPARLRRAIYRYGFLTRRQLDQWADENEYSARGGGIRTGLIVLDKVTEEIERIGDDGDDQRIVWVSDG